MSESVVMKTCTKCGEIKALDQFFKRKDGLLGRQSQCKKCKKDWYLADYRNNPEKYANRAKSWRGNNQDAVRMIRKEYERSSEVRKAYLARKDVKQRKREREKAFHQRNPDAASIYRRRYRQKNNDGRFNAYKKRYKQAMGTGYVKELCIQGTELSAKEVPTVLVEMKRAQLKIYRATKKLKQAIKEIENV